MSSRFAGLHSAPFEMTESVIRTCQSYLRPGPGHYENECVLLHVDPPRLIAWDRISKPLFRVVATFEAMGESDTLLVFRMQFDTERDCDKIRGFAVEKNEENFDRLAAVLTGIGS